MKKVPKLKPGSNPYRLCPDCAEAGEVYEVTDEVRKASCTKDIKDRRKRRFWNCLTCGILWDDRGRHHGELEWPEEAG